MTWPTVAVTTTNTDANSDSPLSARADLLDLMQKVNQMMAHVSTFMATHLDDADAAAARATLGLGSAAVEPTTTFWSTGDAKLTFKAAADSGWIMLNDGSIGNGSSGATTRANADTSALFTLIWNNVSNTWAATQDASGTPVARGASAAADFAANRRLVFPKVLGRALAIAGAGSTLTSRALGEILGAETHTLTSAEMPAHTHTPTGGTMSVVVGSATGKGFTTPGTNTSTEATLNNTGGGGAHNNMPPETFLNVMVKL